jgi:hypothetical protein
MNTRTPEQKKALRILVLLVGYALVLACSLIFRAAVVTPWGAGSLFPLLWTPRELVVFEQMEVSEGRMHNPVWKWVNPDWAIGQYRSHNGDEYDTVVYREFYVPNDADIRMTWLYNVCVQRHMQNAPDAVSFWDNGENNGLYLHAVSHRTEAYTILNFIHDGICGEYLDAVAQNLLGYVPAEETQWTMIHRYGMSLSFGSEEYALVSFTTLPPGVTPVSLNQGELLLPYEKISYAGVTTINGNTYQVVKINGYPMSMEGPYIGIVRMPNGVMDYNPFPIRSEDADVPVSVITVYSPVP